MASVAMACALLGACATSGESTRKTESSSSSKAQSAKPQSASTEAKSQSGKSQSARTQKQAPAAAPTLLTFNWGSELDADVFAVREEFSFKGDSEQISRLEAQFRLHAQRQGDRYRLVFSELRMKIDDKPITENAEPTMLGPITGLVLSYEVAANGDFISLLDIERLKSYSERSYIEQNDKLPPEKRLSPQEAEQAMRSTSSREALQVAASRTWGALVQMWAGVTMTEGKPLTSESSATIPVINAPLTVHSQFELVRREACVSGGRDLACVRLRATSRPDPTQVADASRKLKESRGGAAESLAANAMQVEDRYELLTEPGTLRPRWAEWVRGADIEGSEQGTGLLESRQSVRTRMVFVYK
jgi:hypothetical protein